MLTATVQANKSKAQELQTARDGFKVQLNDMEAAVAEAQKTAQDLEAKLAAAGIQEAELRETIEAAEEDGRKTHDRLQSAEKRAKEVSFFTKRSDRNWSHSWQRCFAFLTFVTG